MDNPPSTGFPTAAAVLVPYTVIQPYVANGGEKAIGIAYDPE